MERKVIGWPASAIVKDGIASVAQSDESQIISQPVRFSRVGSCQDEMKVGIEPIAFTANPTDRPTIGSVRNSKIIPTQAQAIQKISTRDQPGLPCFNARMVMIKAPTVTTDIWTFWAFLANIPNQMTKSSVDQISQVARDGSVCFLQIAKPYGKYASTANKPAKIDKTVLINTMTSC